jgi:AraC-like DNA-binding protein
MDRIVFNTDALPERKRFAAYCEEVAKWCCALDLSTNDQPGFRGNLELRRVGSVEMMTHTLSSIDTVRTSEHLRDGDDALLLMLLLDGHARQSQFDGQCNLNAGDTVICDSAYPGALNLVGESKLLTVKIPRSKLSIQLPDMAHFAGTRLDRDPMARQLLTGYLAGTLDVDLRDSAPATQLHQDHIVDLIALALGTNSETSALAEQRSAKAIRRAAVLREIGASVADPTFDATTVAARLGITVRYVHYLLEATGQTFSKHLLEKRLARIESLLRDPRYAPRRIADIAFEIGFRDLSYFNKTFRRKYGVTPTDVRHAAIWHRRDGGANDT